MSKYRVWDMSILLGVVLLSLHLFGVKGLEFPLLTICIVIGCELLMDLF